MSQLTRPPDPRYCKHKYFSPVEADDGTFGNRCDECGKSVTLGSGRPVDR